MKRDIINKKQVVASVKRVLKRKQAPKNVEQWFLSTFVNYELNNAPYSLVASQETIDIVKGVFNQIQQANAVKERSSYIEESIEKIKNAKDPKALDIKVSEVLNPDLDKPTKRKRKLKYKLDSKPKPEETWFSGIEIVSGPFVVSGTVYHKILPRLYLINDLCDLFLSGTYKHIDKLERVSVPDAEKHHIMWIKQLNKQGNEEEDFDGRKLLHCYDNHYQLVELTSEKCLQREGFMLRHCIAGASYLKKVREGSHKILSIRDEQNKPQITILVEVGKRGYPNSRKKAMSLAEQRVKGTSRIGKELYLRDMSGFANRREFSDDETSMLLELYDVLKLDKNRFKTAEAAFDSFLFQLEDEDGDEDGDEDEWPEDDFDDECEEDDDEEDIEEF